MKKRWFLCQIKQARNKENNLVYLNFSSSFWILWMKKRNQKHLKKFNRCLNWDGPSSEQVLRFSPKFFSARTAAAKRAPLSKLVFEDRNNKVLFFGLFQSRTNYQENFEILCWLEKPDYPMFKPCFQVRVLWFLSIQLNKVAFVYQLYDSPHEILAVFLIVIDDFKFAASRILVFFTPVPASHQIEWG